MSAENSQNDAKTQDLGAGFNAAASLSRLNSDFKAISADATQALEIFEQSVKKLQAREKEFNAHAKPPASAKPSLMTRLRSPAQMKALREFAAAKEGLIDHDPELGQRIANLTAQKIRL